MRYEKYRFEKGGEMDIKKVNAALKILKDNLEDALIATDIYGSIDGQSIAGYNSQPKAAALFNRVTGFLVGLLKEGGFPEIGRYYILDLVDRKILIVIPLGEFQWIILADGKKVQLGLLLNVFIPKIVDAFEEAIAS